MDCLKSNPNSSPINITVVLRVLLESMSTPRMLWQLNFLAADKKKLQNECENKQLLKPLVCHIYLND